MASNTNMNMSVTGFIEEGEVSLKDGEGYFLTGLAITNTNKLLLCNHHSSCPKVYAYTDCKNYESEVKFSSRPWRIAVIPDTDRAVVTLPDEDSIQFINTTTMTPEDKVKVGYLCYGVAAGKDKIFIGDNDGNVHILDSKGSEQNKVYIGQSVTIGNIHYNAGTNEIICRLLLEVRCIDMQGKLVYQYGVSEGYSMAVDYQGQVYIGEQFTNVVKKYSPQGDLLGTVLTRQQGIFFSCASSFNNNFKKFIVINKSGQSVLIFRCT